MRSAKQGWLPTCLLSCSPTLLHDSSQAQFDQSSQRHGLPFFPELVATWPFIVPEVIAPPTVEMLIKMQKF